MNLLALASHSWSVSPGTWQTTTHHRRVAKVRKVRLSNFPLVLYRVDGPSWRSYLVTFAMPNSRGSSLPATAAQSAYCSSTPQPPSWQRPSYGHELEGAVGPSPAWLHNGPDLDQLRGVAAVEDHSRLATMKWAKRGTREAPTKRRALAKS
jgi:hypothetical protein